MKKLIISIANVIVRALIFARSFFNKKVDVLILTDYLGVPEITRSLAERNVTYAICYTKRFPFWTLLRNKGVFFVVGLFRTPDYSPKSLQKIESYCEIMHIKTVLIQAGTFMVPACNKLNQHLGNGKGNGDFASTCSIDKAFFRANLNQKSVGTIISGSLSDVTPQDLIYPCIIKPSVGTGSEGVVLVRDEAELSSLLLKSQIEATKTEFSANFFFEEYIEGLQFDVEGIICDGEVFIVCVVQENYEGFLPEFNYNWFFFNVELPEGLRTKIFETVKKMLSACQIMNGAFHVELRVSDQGDIVLLDFANRMGGGFERLISECTGTDLAGIYTDWMLSSIRPNMINKGKQALIKYFTNDSEFETWVRYLDAEGVYFEASPNVYRGVRKKLVLRNLTSAELCKLKSKFGLQLQLQ